MMRQFDECIQMPLIALIRTAAHCARLIQRAKAYGVFQQWLQLSALGYCLARYFALCKKSDEVAQLARFVGLPDCTETQVEASPFEMAVRIDNMLKSHGYGYLEDDDEEETPAHE